MKMKRGKVMISFVMINSKITDLDFKQYTDNLLLKIKSDLNYDEAAVYDDNEDQIRRCKLRIKEQVYFLSFTHIENRKFSQLIIQIEPRNECKSVADFDKELHELKINIKDLIIDQWEQCVWLTDAQSSMFAEDLYSKVHKVENSLRRLINKIMFYKVGGAWWENYIPHKLKSKYNLRNSSYQQKSPGFKNVHTNLLSMDTDDLLSILELKTYKLDAKLILSESKIKPILLDFPSEEKDLKRKHNIIKFKQKFNDVMFDEKDNELKNSLFKLLKEQSSVEVDFWEEHFSGFFPCTLREFKGYWQNFNSDRNHVAHNKLIEHRLYNKFNQNIDLLVNVIEEAEKKFDQELEKDSKTFLMELELEYIQDQEMQDNHDFLIQEETGVSILTEDDIKEGFLELITDKFEELKDDIYPRLDLQVYYFEPELASGFIEDIFIVESNITDIKITVKCSAEIEDSPGSVSEVYFDIHVNENLSETFKITFSNGSYSYNEEQGNYMPDSKDIFDTQHLNDAILHIHSIIDTEIPVISEEDLASFECEECRKFTVNLSEENGYSVGTCISCGHKNRVGECLRCQEFIDSQEDILCDSCLEYINAQ
jgi:hypothetical protein